MGTLEGVPGRGFRSLLLLVNWELWLERNTRTFKRAERPVHILLLKIKRLELGLLRELSTSLRCWRVLRLSFDFVYLLLSCFLVHVFFLFSYK